MKFIASVLSVVLLVVGFTLLGDAYAQTITTPYQVRRGTQAALNAWGTAPLAGEIICETDHPSCKRGDGSTLYASLGYLGSDLYYSIAAVDGLITDVLDGTSAFTDFNGAVIDYDNLASTLITGLAAVGTFESGDTFMCNEAGVGLRECDYDDLPAGSGGGSPGGADTQVQFNDSSSFGGDTALTWNKTTDVLSVPTIQAADANGLKLHDDGGAGILVTDGGDVEIGTNAASNYLDVKGALAVKMHPNTFNTSSAYTALVVGDTNTAASDGVNGGMYGIGRYDKSNSPFVGLNGWDSGSERVLYFGGGGWDAPDATQQQFFTTGDSGYNETTNTGVERLRILGKSTSTLLRLYSASNGPIELQFIPDGTGENFISWDNNIQFYDYDAAASILILDDDGIEVEGGITQNERSSDMADPSEGSNVCWQSDGTGTGDDGDIICKVTAGGTTKTFTLFDFSAGSIP